MRTMWRPLKILSMFMRRVHVRLLIRQNALWSLEHCPDSQQQKVRDVLQVTNLLGDERYLGLPTSEGHMGKGKFKSTKERLVKRLSSWAERCMSRGAKEVLIKFVAQAIPTYVMGAFKLPAKLCDEITRLIRRF
jgi:hypothetical protein